MTLSSSIRRQRMSQQNILSGYLNKMYKTKNKALISVYGGRVVMLNAKINQMKEAEVKQMSKENRNEINEVFI